MPRTHARLAALALSPALLALASACAPARRYDQAIGVLVDVSGTYADRKAGTVDLIKREILPHLVPGDTLLVVRIDSESYDEANLEALLTLDRRPSHANAQKLALAAKLDEFAARPESSRHTDIPGAIMLAAEYLREIGAGSSALVVFSDLEEDLPRGARRTLRADELAGTRVVAMNVKRLAADTLDPEVYRGRLAGWEKRARSAGALEWRTLVDAAKLPEYLEEIRS
jgi:hypothetical protein